MRNPALSIKGTRKPPRASGVYLFKDARIEPEHAVIHKVGGYFDGKGYYYYINGQQIVPTTAGGAADKVGILPSATSFPDGEEVGLMLATKVGTAAEVKVDIDWWRFAQLR